MTAHLKIISIKLPVGEGNDGDIIVHINQNTVQQGTARENKWA